MPLTGEWARRGACRGTWDERWFPDKATFEADTDVQQFCNVCPVRRDCLDWALRMREQGVWGGTTEMQRDRIKRGISRKACPVCTSVHLNREFNREICMSCGIAWQVHGPKPTQQAADTPTLTQ